MQTNDLKVDEDYLKIFVMSTRSMLNLINDDLNTIEDKNEDLFIRYMYFNRINNIISIIEEIDKLTGKCMRMGFAIKNPILHTDKFRELGWDSLNVEINSFFIKNDKEEITKETKAILKRIFGWKDK